MQVASASACSPRRSPILNVVVDIPFSFRIRISMVDVDIFPCCRHRALLTFYIINKGCLKRSSTYFAQLALKVFFFEGLLKLTIDFVVVPTLHFSRACCLKQSHFRSGCNAEFKVKHPLMEGGFFYMFLQAETWLATPF